MCSQWQNRSYYSGPLTLRLFWTPCHTACIEAKAKFLLSFFLLEERGMQTIISDRKNRRLGWYLLVAKLAKLMKIRLPELHGMLLSDITEHSRKKKKTYCHQKITQRNNKEQFNINSNNVC